MGRRNPLHNMAYSKAVVREEAPSAAANGAGLGPTALSALCLGPAEAGPLGGGAWLFAKDSAPLADPPGPLALVKAAAWMASEYRRR